MKREFEVTYTVTITVDADDKAEALSLGSKKLGHWLSEDAHASDFDAVSVFDGWTTWDLG